jgi:hypothetical protein
LGEWNVQALGDFGIMIDVGFSRMMEVERCLAAE